MPVKPVLTRKRKPPKGRKRRVEAVKFPGLPTKTKEAVWDPRQFTVLLYGRQKIGKTTWFASFPETLFLTTEPGTKGLEIFEYNSKKGGCKSWEVIRHAVKLLEEDRSRFQTVVIDTADRAYDMCMDYVCKQLGIPHPGEAESGKSDYGRSWKEVKKEFTSIVHRILQTGRGLGFTSHAREENFQSRSGEDFTRIYPSMPGQARGVVESLVDMFFYCEYMRAPDGSNRRVIITEGDEMVWAGHRRIAGNVKLPRLIPMTETKGYEIYEEAFKGEPVGLDPTTLLPVKGATEAVKKFFRGIRTKGGNGKKTPKKKRKK